LITVITIRSAAIVEKTALNSTAIAKDRGRKNALKIANNFISPAPILNFNKSGESARVEIAFSG
jgi:hypothetical protein